MCDGVCVWVRVMHTCVVVCGCSCMAITFFHIVFFASVCFYMCVCMYLLSCLVNIFVCARPCGCVPGSLALYCSMHGHVYVRLNDHGLSV